MKWLLAVPVVLFVAWRAGKGGVVAPSDSFGFLGYMPDESLLSAGDENSNFLFDAMDSIQSNFTDWPSGSAPYRGLIERSANQYGVPVSILAWLLWKESRYNPNIVNGSIRSSVGAMGIAQFMPATARDLGIDPLDPDQAIPAAAKYLAQLYRARGNWTEALAAYNWGIGNVTRKGLAAAPAETRDYYSTILARADYQENLA